MDSHFDHVSSNKQSHRQQLGVIFDEEFDQLLPLFDPMQQRAILRAKDSNISSWLSVLPLARNQFDLSAQEYRDGLALRHKKPLLSLPSVCDGCGAPFLVLSMPLTVALGAWSLVGTMRFGMLLVTLILWFGLLLLRSQLCVMDLLVLTL